MSETVSESLPKEILAKVEAALYAAGRPLTVEEIAHVAGTASESAPLLAMLSTYTSSAAPEASARLATKRNLLSGETAIAMGRALTAATPR